MKKYGPFSPEKDNQFSSDDFIGRLDRIESDASTTMRLMQDLVHQVDRISERLEPLLSKEPTAAPSTPVKEATLPAPTSASKSPISPTTKSASTTNGGASRKSTAVPYGTPSEKGLWYGVKRGLNGCKLVTNSWAVCESVTKDEDNKPFTGAQWRSFDTATKAFDFIDS